MEKTKRFFGILGIIIFSIGSIFKFLHFPGAHIMLLTGTFFLCLFYLPIQLIDDWNKFQKTFNKIYLVFRFLTFFFLLLGFCFKLLHWPGSGFLRNGTLLSAAFFIVTYIYKRFKERILKDSWLSDIVIITICLLIFWFIENIGTPGRIRQAVANIDSEIQQSTNGYALANEKLLESLLQLDTVQLDQIKSVKEVGVRSEEMIKYLAEFRRNLIQMTISYDSMYNENADLMEIFYEFDKTELPTEILFGTGEKYIKTQFSALEFKEKLTNYRNDIINILEKENCFVGAVGAGLDMNDEKVHYWKKEAKYPWEERTFHDKPIGLILLFINRIENAIRQTEYSAYLALMTNMRSSGDQSSLVKLAHLESEYAIEKNASEMEHLIKEKKINELELENSRAQINQQNFTIFGVIVGLVFVFILLILSTRAFVVKKKTNKLLADKNTEIEEQKTIVEDQNKEILDSIAYAKRIQQAILPPAKLVKEYLTESFILYLPKDIVAGDFYWFDVKGDEVYFAAADCTGHGVPGAMVSVVCANSLKRAVNELKISEPAKILDKVRELVIETFEKSEEEVKDGMDISFCKLNLKTRKLTYSGAHNPLYRITEMNGEVDEKTLKNETHMLLEYKGDKQPIGKHSHEKPFSQKEIQLLEGDSIYISTDGYPDQFGGEKGKKYLYKRFKQFFLTIHEKDMEVQRTDLIKDFESWKGKQEQVDDVCVIGVRV